MANAGSGVEAGPSPSEGEAVRRFRAWAEGRRRPRRSGSSQSGRKRERAQARTDAKRNPQRQFAKPQRERLIDRQEHPDIAAGPYDTPLHIFEQSKGASVERGNRN